MTVSMKHVYFFTIIVLAIRGSENEQVSCIHMLITTPRLTSVNTKSVHLCSSFVHTNIAFWLHYETILECVLYSSQALSII
jgi:hypothetical protein